MNLTEVTEVTIADEVLDQTLEFLANAGKRSHEAFVVWGGIVDGPLLRFTSSYAPAQTAHETPHGLLVTVDGDALFRMNKAFYERGEIAAGQVHTHPTEAYHSDTDDHFPLVTLRGAISLVVPDFAQRGRASADRWAWYRLVDHAEWEPLPSHVSITIDS